MPNNKHEPWMFSTLDTVTIYKSYPTGVWVVKEDGVEYPVFVVVGGYTWCVINAEVDIVFECNFVPYTFHVKDKHLCYILGPANELLDEYIIPTGSSHIKHFFKRRTVNGVIEEVNIGRRFDSQRYGTGKDKGGAQQKYTSQLPHWSEDCVSSEPSE
ncbi:hypothetical protein [Pseudomonas phage D6]|nr:hypothetical protein [Pseudomonas phage D6]